MVQILSYIATALVLIAVYYIANLRLRGQFLILAAEAIWLLYSSLTGQWALAVQSVVLFGLGVVAVRNWRREKIPF